MTARICRPGTTSLLALAVIAWMLGVGWASASHAEARSRLSLDGEWRFARQDMEDAQADVFESRGWARVTVPHTFNAQDGEAGGSYYRGPAWYRREVLLPEGQEDRRNFLQFGGAALSTQVWMNGRFVGRHDGGYAAFRFDVTDAVRPGRNTIAVRVDNTKLAHVAPLAGDFTIFGGLYRSVELVTTSDVHVDMLDYGGPGIYAHTREVAGGQAVVAVRARVTNSRRAQASAVLRTTIVDASGRVAAHDTSRLTLPASTTRELVRTLRIARPRLWHGRDDPHLYRVTTELLSPRAGRGEVLDAVIVPLGVRTFNVDPNRGLLLNGRPYRLYGANVSHSGRPGRGLVVTDAEIDEEVALMAEMGATGLRLTHVQHPQRMYERADTTGLLISTEVPLVNEIGEGPAFMANAVSQLRELIRQNYNHPSILFWGLGNELRTSSVAANAVLARLQAVAKAEDPMRLTAYAHCCGPDDDPLTTHADLLGFNRYFGWYGDEFTKIETWMDGYRRARPGLPFALSEYGAGGSVFQQEDPPRRPLPDGQWHPEQYQALFHEAYWPALSARPYLWSTFVWVGFDLASDRRNEGDRAGVNDKGLVNYDRRTRKQAYYWYKANWATAPVVYITSRRLTPRRVSPTEVKVYSNLKTATLIVNDVSLGPRAVEGRIARWPDVKLASGLNRISVTATDGDRTVSDQVEWSLGSVETAPSAEER